MISSRPHQSKPLVKTVVVEGKHYEASIDAVGDGRITIPELGVDERLVTEKGPVYLNILHINDGVIVLRDGRQTRIAFADRLDVDLDAGQGGDAGIKAPMHGKLIAILVKTGDRVAKGQKLAIVEAMKMEHALVAPRDGSIGEILAGEGTQVAEGARILLMTSAEV